jgi:predicted  nucleic acid-binding Zn-ribbon protein
MYVRCPKCGNDTFRITSDKRAECIECGNMFDICLEKLPEPTPPKPPEPLPPKKPEKYWFR